MNREILEKPFNHDQIKQREGNFGKMLDYIEGHTVIQRLNDAFDSDWSFTINQHEIIKEANEVIVIGELKAGNVVKTQFGSSRITRAKDDGEIISLADDLKAAATDALKKAATLLGVGLHLYRNNQPNMGNRPQGQRYNNSDRNNGGNGNQYNRSQQSNRNSHIGNGSNSYCGNGNGNGRLSGKQYKYMIQLNEEQGRTKADLDQQCIAMFGIASEYLSKADASAVINQLLSR